MTSAQIHRLLVPPDVQASRRKILLYLDSKFNSLGDLGDLESTVADAQQRNDELKSQVS